ncbi:hypothetical protein SLEP1_g59939, partial [Rubroshorea leprosula]
RELNGVLCNDRRSKGIDARKTEVGLHADLKNDEAEYKSHGELERGQKENEGGQPESFIKWEQTEVDKSRDGMEMKMEVRSNKWKKQRSRKRKHSVDIGQNNDENLKRFFVKEPIENDGGDGVQKDSFKMESSINREKPGEVGLHAAPAGIGEVKTEVKLKKNRKRSKPKKYSNSEALSCNDDVNFESFNNREQCTIVGHNTGASGVGELKGVVKSSEGDQVPCEDKNGNCAVVLKEADREVKHGKVKGVSFSVEKFEKYVGEQTDDGAANKTRDTVESKNRKPRSKKRKHSDDVTHSNGEKVCNFENMEQSKRDGNNGPVADGLEEKMVEIKHSELNGVLVNDGRSEGIDARKTEFGLHADIKNDEVEYKSCEELERGQKKNEGGRPGSFVRLEQTQVDKSRNGMEMETEVRSNKRKKQRSKKGKRSVDIGQNNDENLKRFFVKEPIENDGGDGVHKDAFKMESGINREQPEEVGLHAAPVRIGEVKTEVKSKKNRKRSKEKKYSNSEALSCNDDGEFKSCGS